MLVLPEMKLAVFLGAVWAPLGYFLLLCDSRYLNSLPYFNLDDRKEYDNEEPP